MTELFSKILDMSLTGSVVILFVLAARLLLKKAPKVYSYALWAVVLFRLLCPVSLSAPVSLLGFTDVTVMSSSGPVTEGEGITTSVTYLPVEYVYSTAEEKALPEITEGHTKVEPAGKVSGLEPMTMVAWIWLAGVAVMLLYSAVTYLRLYWQLVGAVLWRGDVWLADHIASPFATGILRPKIYLPSGTPMRERRWIIAHERHHIRRGDHIIKLMAYGALCLHWFNPLAWIAFIQAGKDMEMSCDEAVIKKLGSHIRADYCETLLRLATHQRIIAGTPLAFGEGETKGRVKNMAKWKKPKLWVSILCGVLCIAILAACALNPAETENKEVSEENAALREGTWDGQFKLDLPEGYEFSRDENGNMVFTDGTNIIGGKNDYKAPEGFNLVQYFSKDFMIAMGVPEASDETLCHSGGGSTGKDGYSVEYFSDVPEGVERTVHTHHTFFVMNDGTTIYDVWFDLLVVDPTVKTAILNSIEIPEIGRVSEEPVPAAFSEESINILLTVFSGETENAMADLTLLVSVAPDFSQVTLGSILKDTYVSLPDYQGHVTGNNKFSACYALGKAWGGTEGAEEMVNQCIRNNFGIIVDHNLELIDPDFAGLTEILRDFTGKLDAPLSADLQTISEQLLTMVTDSDHPSEWEKAKEALASAQWADCTIPGEGTYTAAEMDIGGTMQYVLVVNGEQSTKPAEAPVQGSNVVTDTEVYRNSFTSTDGTVDFQINGLLTGDFTDVSILEAEPHYLTEEDVQRVAHAIFGEDAYFTEKTPGFAEYHLTEKQIQDAIDRMMPYTTAEAWTELCGSGGMHGISNEESAQNTQGLIDAYQKKLDNFRNDYPEEPCRWKWRNDGYYLEGYAMDDMGDGIEAFVEMDGISYDFHAYTRNGTNFKINNIYVLAMWPTGYSELDDRVLYRQLCSTEPTQEQIAETVSRAGQMLQDMELGEWIIDETYVEVIEYHHPEIPEYVIHVNAVPVIDGVAEIRREQHSNINTASQDKPEDNYYLTQAEFEFAPGGQLLNASIMSPMDTEEISRTNTMYDTKSLLSIAEEALMGTNIDGYGLNVTEMGYEGVKCHVTITGIRSGMARQRLHGTDATYQYFPALALYGNVTYEFANGDKIDHDGEIWNLMTVNALYGSIITNFGA